MGGHSLRGASSATMPMETSAFEADANVVGEPSRFCVFGAATDTPNLGVSALAYSAVQAVIEARPGAEVTIFDNGSGSRLDDLVLGERNVRVSLQGARHSKRLHRGDTLRTIRAAGMVGLGNAVLDIIDEADAALDLSGGDSFTDLYGRDRLEQILLHKKIVLAQNRPLVLLPQTYGPFTTTRSERAARSIIRRAEEAWARDERSYGWLAALLGPDFDPDRHRLGVDVAFALPISVPRRPAPAPLDAWLAEDRDTPVVGINVSGLVYLDESAALRFGLRADYRSLVFDLVARLLDTTDVRILLVPHVLAPVGHPESDLEASRLLIEHLGDRATGRVAVAPLPEGPSEAKWWISQTDWFCGTRMHSTIAALSSGTPACAIAYSVKTEGVFATCGQSDHVADATDMATGEALERALWSFEHRDEAREELALRMPPIAERAVGQIRSILDRVAPVSVSSARARVWT